MIGKLLGKEEVSAALVLALSGAVMVLVAKGYRPLSLGQVVGGVLSNPVPIGEAGTHPFSVASSRLQQVSA